MVNALSVAIPNVLNFKNKQIVHLCHKQHFRGLSVQSWNIMVKPTLCLPQQVDL